MQGSLLPFLVVAICGVAHIMLQKYGLAWWALQLPVVRVVVGSFSFRLFEQQVNFDKANCVVHYI